MSSDLIALRRRPSLGEFREAMGARAWGLSERELAAWQERLEWIASFAVAHAIQNQTPTTTAGAEA